MCWIGRESVLESLRDRAAADERVWLGLKT
jgi:hypothetical protein